jgi:hypothetical protein
LCAQWGEELGCPFEVIHDESSVIQRWKPLLERLMRPNEVPLRVGYDQRQFELPLRATGIRLVDSESSLPVQIADLLAGATAHLTRAKSSGAEDSFAEALEEGGLLSLVVDTLWPTPIQEFLERGRSRGQGSDPLEATRRLMFGD